MSSLAALLLALAGLVTMRETAISAGPYLRLGDVAEVQGDPLWEDILLGAAPEAGTEAVVTREEVKARLAWLGVGAEVAGSERTMVTRGEAPPRPGAGLRAEVDRLLRMASDEPGVTWALGGAALDTPPGWPSRDVPEVVSVRAAGSGEAEVVLRNRESGEEARFRIRPLRLRRAVVAARVLKASQRVAEGDAAMREMPADQVPLGAFDHPADCVGRLVQRPVAEGAVLSQALLVGPKAVSRGQVCRLAVRSGNVTASCPAKALAEGRVGQEIPFEIADTKVVVTATVVSEGAAEARLGGGR